MPDSGGIIWRREDPLDDGGYFAEDGGWDPASAGGGSPGDAEAVYPPMPAFPPLPSPWDKPGWYSAASADEGDSIFLPQQRLPLQKPADVDGSPPKAPIRADGAALTEEGSRPVVVGSSRSSASATVNGGSAKNGSSAAGGKPAGRWLDEAALLDNVEDGEDEGEGKAKKDVHQLPASAALRRRRR